VRLGGGRRGWYVIADQTLLDSHGAPKEWGDDPEDTGQEWADHQRFIVDPHGKIVIEESGDASSHWMAMSFSRAEAVDIDNDGVDEVLVWGSYGTDGMSMAISGVGIYGLDTKKSELVRLLAIQLEAEPADPRSDPDEAPPACKATLAVVDAKSGREVRLTSKTDDKTPSDWTTIGRDEPLLPCFGNGTYALDL
jgi:hypothetical protein